MPNLQPVIYTNLHIGFVAVGLLLGSYALFQLPVNGSLLVLAFCGTFLVYQCDQAIQGPREDAINQPGRLAWMAQHQRYVWGSSLLALLGCLVALWFVEATALVVGGLLRGVGLLYSAPLLPGGRRLKQMGLAKPIVISGGWAIGAVVLPLVDASHALTLGVVGLTLYRFLFILPNLLMVDWLDRIGDAHVGVYTLATRLTLGQIRKVGVVALLMALGGGLGAVWWLGAPGLLYVDSLGLLLMMALLSKPWPAPRPAYGFVLDILVAWPLVTAAFAWLTGQ